MRSSMPALIFFSLLLYISLPLCAGDDYKRRSGGSVLTFAFVTEMPFVPKPVPKWPPQKLQKRLIAAIPSLRGTPKKALAREGVLHLIRGSSEYRAKRYCTRLDRKSRDSRTLGSNNAKWWFSLRMIWGFWGPGFRTS